jgi:hypothetical protein
LAARIDHCGNGVETQCQRLSQISWNLRWRSPT